MTDVYKRQVLRTCYQDDLIVAVDASVGNREHVGYVTLGKGALKPGLGVSKELRSVGDIFITGIVGSCGNCLLYTSYSRKIGLCSSSIEFRRTAISMIVFMDSTRSPRSMTFFT